MSRNKCLYLMVSILMLVICYTSTYALFDIQKMAKGVDSDEVINQYMFERINSDEEDFTSSNMKECNSNNGSSVTKYVYPAVYDGETAQLKTVIDMEDNEISIWDSSVKNVVDNFVYVENMSSTPLYIKTYLAFEKGALTTEEFEKYIKLNLNNSSWTYEVYSTNYSFENNNYYILVARYVDEDNRLSAYAITEPNLLQVIFDKTVTNEVFNKIDLDGNGQYKIMVETVASEIDD